MQITIYSTTTCPYCRQEKDYLTSKNIAFSEKMIDTDDAAQKEMAEASNGFLGVPYTLIVKDDGTRESILGFDIGKINSTLNL